MDAEMFHEMFLNNIHVKKTKQNKKNSIGLKLQTTSEKRFGYQEIVKNHNYLLFTIQYIT